VLQDCKKTKALTTYAAGLQRKTSGEAGGGLYQYKGTFNNMIEKTSPDTSWNISHSIQEKLLRFSNIYI
jgi:hypothetical protein